MHFLASLKYIKSFREIKTIGKIDNIQKCIQFMKDHLEEKNYPLVILPISVVIP